MNGIETWVCLLSSKSRRLRSPRGRAPAPAGPLCSAEAEVRCAAGVRGEHDGPGGVVVPARRGVPDVRRAARHRIPLRGGGGALQGAVMDESEFGAEAAS